MPKAVIVFAPIVPIEDGIVLVSMHNRTFIKVLTFHHILTMTQTTVKKQVKAIRKATADATKSPENARAFLIEAGIITDEGTKRKTSKKTK